MAAPTIMMMRRIGLSLAREGSARPAAGLMLGMDAAGKLSSAMVLTSLSRKSFVTGLPRWAGRDGGAYSHVAAGLAKSQVP